jgi:dihydrofolate synthase/folylpolyglutamate synthase
MNKGFSFQVSIFLDHKTKEFDWFSFGKTRGCGVKTYSEAAAYLEKFINYEKQLDKLEYNERQFNLEGFREFLSRLQNPQDTFRSLHIAGTKGKGSVAAMLEAALFRAGVRVGLYTSPHLGSYLERFRIQGMEMPEERFVSSIDQLTRLQEERGGKPPQGYRTVFEILTALAFVYFHEEKIDIAVLETGLGGRLDATNVVSPLVSIITSLGLEHTNLLGTTLSEISREKGGIIKPHVPVILSRQEEEKLPEILPVLTGLCESQDAPLLRADKEIRFVRGELIRSGGNRRIVTGQRLFFQLKKGEECEVMIPLLGPHQIENCRTALATLMQLKEMGIDFDFPKAVEGISETHWPGRIEVACSDPLIILDGAHCPLSAKALRITLEECFPSCRRIYLLGILKGKDVPGIAGEIAKDPMISRIITFPPPSPRGIPAEELGSLIRPLFPVVDAVSSYEQAFDKSLAQRQTETMIVITGSLYNVDPFKKLILKNKMN